MQPNPPPPEFPQQGPPPMPGGPAAWAGGPNPAAPPRANATAARVAGVLALLTVSMFVWFGLYNIVHAHGPTGGMSGLVLVNVLGGALGAGGLLVAAGFTFARRIPGAWTLCVLCTLSTVSVLVVAPILWGIPFSDQINWIFGFEKSNGVAVALAIIFGMLTAFLAAVAASVKSYEPSTAPPDV